MKQPSDVMALLAVLPPLSALKDFVAAKTLRASLEAIHPLLFRLFQWIIATNRCHIVLLPEEDRLKSLNTPWQFVLKSSAPEKEARFLALKEENKGSFFAFHGSPTGNWHSILRQGLRNKNYRTAYGPGIYFAEDLSTSVGYASANNAGWQHSEYFKGSLMCVAFVEIVEYGSQQECKGKVHRIKCNCNKNSPYYRVEDEDMLTTRFFFVFDRPSGTGHKAKNTDLAAEARDQISRTAKKKI